MIHIENSEINFDRGELVIHYMRVIRDDDPMSQRVFDAIAAACEAAANGPRIEFDMKQNPPFPRIYK